MDQSSFDSFYIKKCAVLHLPLIMAGSVSTITLFCLVAFAMGDGYSAGSIQVILACHALGVVLAYACNRMARRDNLPGIVASVLIFQGVTTFAFCYRAYLDQLGMVAVYYLCLLALLLGVVVAPNVWVLIASWIVVLGQVTLFSLADSAALPHQNRQLVGFIIASVATTGCLFPLMQSLKWGAFRLLVESFERSTTDPLTGLANRMAWSQQVQARIGGTVDTPPRLATVLYMDLNDLKKINDEFGHPAGDRVLVEIGDVLRRSLPDNAIISRFGGDEFVAFIPDRDSKEVERIVASLHAAIRMNPNTQHHSIGIGIADYLSPEPIDAALHRADLALLREKRDRRARIAQSRIVRDANAPAEPMPLGSHLSRLPAAASDPG